MHTETGIYSGICSAVRYGTLILGELTSKYLNSTFLTFSRPKLEALADRMSNAPLLGIFGVLLNDWIPLIDEYYYCKYYLTYCDIF